MFRTTVESEPRAFATLFRICIIHTYINIVKMMQHNTNHIN